MEVLITACSKEKKLDARLLPAAERYISARIAQVIALGEKLGRQVYNVITRACDSLGIELVVKLVKLTNLG